MTSILQRARSNEEGFTLIELLVVILIIGILSAIAVPAFLNQRTTAHEASIKTDLKMAATAMETSIVKNKGIYPDTLPEMKTSEGVILSMKGPIENGFVNQDGFTRVNISKNNGTGKPSTNYIYIKIVGSTFSLYSSGPQFTETSEVDFNLSYTCQNGVKKEGSYYAATRYANKISSSGTFSVPCPGDKMTSLEIYSKNSSNIERYFITERVNIPVSPIPTSTQKDTFCISGSHSDPKAQVFKYDSANSGLTEGSC